MNASRPASVTKTLRSGFTMGTAAIVQALLAFGANIILTHKISPDSFGRFFISLATIGMITAVLSPRLPITILRRPDEDFAHTRGQLFSASVQEPVYVAIVASAVFAAAGFSRLQDFILIIAASLSECVVNIKAFHERSLHYRQLAILETSIQLVGHTVAISLAFAHLGDTALYVRELAYGITGLIGLASLRAFPRDRLTFVRLRHWYRLFIEVRGVWLDQTLEGLFGRAVTLSVAWLSGEVGTGLFSQAQRLAQIPHQFLAPVASRVALNYFSRTERVVERWALLRRLAGGLLAVSIVAAIACGLLGPPLIPVLFGSRWTDSGPILRVLALGIVFMTTSETTKVFMIASHQNRGLALARLSQIASFAIVAAAMVACGLRGTLAVAVAWSLSFAAILLTGWFAGRRALNHGV